MAYRGFFSKLQSYMSCQQSLIFVMLLGLFRVPAIEQLSQRQRNSQDPPYLGVRKKVLPARGTEPKPTFAGLLS
jgi:hypothetical protein